MSIADELALLANTKENLRVSLGLSNDVPFSQYKSYIYDIPSDGEFYDFVKNRFFSDGETKSFSDMPSQFIRLSSATEWQDGQLVEVQNDIPRISVDGLLIEPQRTNIFTNTFLTNGNVEGTSPPLKVEYVDSAFAQFTSTSTRFDFQPYTAVGYASSRGRFPNSVATLVNGENYRFSFYASHNSVNTPYVGGLFVYIVGDTSSPRVALPKTNTGQSNIRYSTAWTHNEISGTASPVVYVSSAIGSEVVSASINAVQVESGDISSFIPTTSSPVTRSKETLTIPFTTGQTVTADKDAGVTMTIVDNNAVFEGHGYIRSIGVN